MRCSTVLSLGAVLALAGWGCGDDDGGTQPPPSLVEEAWEAFEAGEMDHALAHFEEAVAEDPTDPEAHNGLGWTRLAGFASIEPALESFDAALANGFTGADPDAGKALALRDVFPSDYAGAVAAATAALVKDADFVFAHDTTLDWRDLRLVLAHAHYALGAYAEAYAQVTTLGGASLDTEGENFPQQLLVEIDRLTKLYGG